MKNIKIKVGDVVWTPDNYLGKVLQIDYNKRTAIVSCAGFTDEVLISQIRKAFGNKNA